MMKLKELRLREFAPIGGAGSQVLQSHQVDMLLDVENQVVYARRRSSGEHFIVPLTMLSYMKPEAPLKEIVEAFPTPKPPPLPTKVETKAEAPVEPQDDSIRFEKVNGRVVEVRSKK